MSSIIGQTSLFSLDRTITGEIACNASVQVLDWVRLQSGVIVRGQADNFTNSLVIGLVIAKPTATTCIVQTAGVTENIFVTLDLTKLYFLDPSTAGAMTTTVPTGAGEIVLQLGRAVSTQQFVIIQGQRMRRAL